MPISDNTLKELEQVFAKRKAYQIIKTKTQRNLDATNPTIGEVVDVLATLLSDLKEQKVLK